MILVATGLKREARILAGPEVCAIAGGGDRMRLERELDAAAGQASAVLSMGLCGALAQGLKPGDWVVATAVLGDGRNRPTDLEWRSVLAQRLAWVRTGPILGSDTMIADVDAKRDAHQATGAIAVDMESHIAAAVAARHRLPFAVARVVSDAADQSLPEAAQAGMAADGRMDIWAVLRALALRPFQLGALIRTGVEAETAFRALKRSAADLIYSSPAVRSIAGEGDHAKRGGGGQRR